MSDNRREPSDADIAHLQESLAEIAAQLSLVNDQVQRLAAAQQGAPAPSAAPAPQPAPALQSGPAPQSAPVLQSGPAPQPATYMTEPPTYAAHPPTAGPFLPPASPAQHWPVPFGAVAGSSASSGAPAALHHRGGYASPASLPASQPMAAGAREPRSAASWVDTSGLKILGWVAGGVTLLGVVLLLVVAIQQELLSPTARVGVGAILGAVLVAAGHFVHRAEKQAALATTLVCTGLATEFLVAVGAVHLADPLPPMAGHAFSLLIVGVAVVIASQWQQPWLAAIGFVVSALLAPVVADDFNSGVYIFEAVLLLGGLACLLTKLGTTPWAASGVAVGFIMVVAMSAQTLSEIGLLTVIVVVVIIWVTLLGRWLTGAEAPDPGPFAIRPRSYDPVQIAKDYADLYEHNARAAAARRDRQTASASLAASAGVLAVALLTVVRPGLIDIPVGATAAAFATLFAVLAWISPRLPELRRVELRVICWCAALAFAAVALMRLLGGDARSIAWIVLAILMLLAVGAERMRSLLTVTLIAAAVALLSAAPALDPSDLLTWPPARLLTGDGLMSRAWTAVLPAGLAVLVLCAVAWWAVSRCTVVTIAPTATGPAGVTPSAPAQFGSAAPITSAVPRVTEESRAVVMGWTLVFCCVVGCYGLIAITMVLAYAVAPTSAGFQAGQIVVTGLLTVVALGLLGLGVRRLILRIGGLGIAAIAVGKLLLFDTQSLQALPRALTVIAVGALLLLAAVGYVMALGRQRAAGDNFADSQPHDSALGRA